MEYRTVRPLVSATVYGASSEINPQRTGDTHTQSVGDCPPGTRDCGVIVVLEYRTVRAFGQCYGLWGEQRNQSTESGRHTDTKCRRLSTWDQRLWGIGSWSIGPYGLWCEQRHQSTGNGGHTHTKCRRLSTSDQRLWGIGSWSIGPYVYGLWSVLRSMVEAAKSVHREWGDTDTQSVGDFSHGASQRL